MGNKSKLSYSIWVQQSQQLLKCSIHTLIATLDIHAPLWISQSAQKFGAFIMISVWKCIHFWTAWFIWIYAADIEQPVYSNSFNKKLGSITNQFKPAQPVTTGCRNSHLKRTLPVLTKYTHIVYNAFPNQ